MATFIDLMHGGPRWALETIARFGGGGDTEATTYTSSLPDYAEPYYMNLMNQSEALANEAYIPYDQQRIADFSGYQQQAFGGAQDLYDYGNPALTAGINTAATGAGAAMDAVNNPNPLESTYGGAQDYNAMQFSPEQLQAQAIDPSGMYVDPSMIGVDQFGTEQRDQYMSPYQDAVTEQVRQQAILDDQRAAVMRDSEAVNAGAFGGDRRFVGDYLAEEGLQDRLTDITTSGRQSAFENAQQQFERDRAARFGADQSNQRAGLEAGQANLNALVQSGGMNQDAYLKAMGLGESSRQFGADLGEQGAQFGASQDAQLGQFNKQYGLDAINAAYGGADMLGNLGTADQTAFLERMDTMYGMGAAQQQKDQEGYDTAYEDFINQRDAGRNAMTWLSGIMHGVPVSANSSVIEPAPNQFSQALGAGIAGYGAYQSFQD